MANADGGERATRSDDAELLRRAVALRESGDALRDAGKLREALDRRIELVEVCRVLAVRDPAAYTLDLVNSLRTLAVALYQCDEPARALETNAVEIAHLRGLVGADRERYVLDLALSLFNRGCFFEWLGPLERALQAFTDSLDLYREFNGLAETPHYAVFGRALNSTGSMLSRLGRREEARQTLVEAVAVWRRLVDRNRSQHLAGLAEGLSGLAHAYEHLGQTQQARLAAQEAVALARELVVADRARFLPDLARYVNNFTLILDDLGQHAEALVAAREAVALARELIGSEQARHLRWLAVALVNLCIRLAAAHERAEAVAAAQEAIACYRKLRLGEHSPLYLDFVAALFQAGLRHSEAGQSEAAEHLFGECAAALLRVQPTNPYDWCSIARFLIAFLDGARHLRDWHLPLVRLLVEHRELAWDSGHAALFLGVQQRLIERVWRVASALPAHEGALRDDALAALIAAAHSPDFARWLESRAVPGGSLARLAELKRNVIDAEQVLAAMRRSTGDDGGVARATAGVGALEEIEAQLTKARRLREAFRAERARLTAEDSSFAAAFDAPGIVTMRRVAAHAGAGALLCLLEIGREGERRVVGVLVHADDAAAQCFELPGLLEFVDDISGYLAEQRFDLHRGLLRGGAPPGVHAVVVDQSPILPIVDLFAVGMHEWFWVPLQRVLDASGARVERLHLCLSGSAQQLPLALRRTSDCPGLEVVLWPGLPYLRFAAFDAQAAPVAEHWIVGHDCAWSSAQPLPMVAVEAALLRDLLQRYGRPVESIRTATGLSARISALVTCCHGGAERAQFDHALHLGPEPLTVRRIVQERIGPALALLPACHAGRTDEDAAGNALGVAAAFMLSGSKVVTASSKAVPDLLQPWLSTLTLWHAVHGLPHHQAALRAREQFAHLDFPEAYRDWLQSALPAALATIQPGGDEDPHIQGATAQLALELVAEHWPWEGDAAHLFSPDPVLCAEATRSVASGVLQAPSADSARVVAIAAREMAAFVFVYGVDTNGSRPSA